MNLKINESDLRTLLDTTHDPVVAVFSATWCGPCRAFAPIFEKVAQSFADAPNGENAPKFAKMDVDECNQLCEDIGISVVPTLIIFKDSKVIARKEGAFGTESHFVNWLDSQGVKRK